MRRLSIKGHFELDLSVMAEPIRLGTTTSEFLIEAPAEPTATAVLFLPGITGGAFSDRFQPVVDACLKSGFAIARVSAWENAEDVEGRNLADIYKDIADVITYLYEHGYTRFFGVGKSFGGAVMLTIPSAYISKKVLWAPAIGVTEFGSNIDVHMTATLGTLHHLLDMRVDAAFLKEREMPMLIIHGTADNVIPFSNSEKIVSMLPNAKLVPIEGADHSYNDKEHEKAVIGATMEFLTAGASALIQS